MSSEWTVEGLESSLGGFHLGPVDLSVGAGEAVAVLGRSGAGKTTLLRTLAGFLPAQGGRVLAGGSDITAWAPEHRGLGYVPQGLGLLPHRTVRANIVYPLELRDRPDPKRRVGELLEEFDLLALADRRPAALSGGERQRVAIARALAADPTLIVWDEPWQGLDVLARDELGRTLQRLRQRERIPVVIVTHDPALAFSVADTFLLLEAGRVRTRGDPARWISAPVDAFAARFAGYENVFDRTELAQEPAGSLGAWLAGRSGPEGVAFASPEAGVPGAAWEGSVEAVRPSPDGTRIEVRSGGLPVQLRLDRAAPARLPTAGERIRFGVEPGAVRRLGDEPDARAGGQRCVRAS